MGCLIFLLALALVFGIDCGFAWLVMVLWNVIAGSYGFAELTFWPSFCGVVLLSIIAGIFKPLPPDYWSNLFN